MVPTNIQRSPCSPLVPDFLLVRSHFLLLGASELLTVFMQRFYNRDRDKGLLYTFLKTKIPSILLKEVRSSRRQRGLYELLSFPIFPLTSTPPTASVRKTSRVNKNIF